MIISRLHFRILVLLHWRPSAAGQGYGNGVRDIINYVSTLKPSQFVRPYGWMDPDFLETLFPLTLSYVDSKTEFSFWSLWSAPLIVATDIRHLSEEKASIVMNSEVIAVDQDTYSAGDIIANNTDGTQVWAKPMSNGDMVVILFNQNDNSNQTIAVEWTDLGWQQNSVVSVRDLWAHSDLGSFLNGFNTSVGPHDVFMFRASYVSESFKIE